ncbi:D-alanyl-D-alanine carboxypeptidase/D-alanyl-D-alanine-endopeptidase [Draconibacterium sp. IB214405]|uniref:D-alanyl-D-alanine carboxypeptidase/D-alanyl-D-alanine endopeptidase n=1 Tax=Draconibacterium sp. IB214405 TaxID=3097352 RepID=UPI002A137797|nr:D-alanyl-D-alanine carboxypeptidase/D-alanyl-D-alanine-endopeptidase [Draconibacterium sp. IB214405]MDX8339944.1 D-alanyl-D-alanine carboxypeptidase/D-alanyl-D-alanine-endopeptidase [Draconibacterium sp. IB214405]
MQVRYFSLLFLLVFCGQILAQNSFKSAVEKLLQQENYKNALVGINVLELNSGEPVFSLNPEKLLAPASTMKMITSGTALQMLGADYRFKTQISYTGKIDKNGVLNGDLVLIAGADPALGSEYFQDHYFEFLKNWAKQVKASGIIKVKGNLILDAGIYDTERIPDSWVWGDIGNYYGAGPDAFTVFDNMYRITFSSPKKEGKLTKVIQTYPKIDGLQIENEVLSADSNSDNAYVFGGPFDKHRVIRGTIPRNRKAFTIKASIPNPDEVLAQAFLQNLSDEGVFVEGETRYEKNVSKKTELIYTQDSPTLAEIAEVLNHESVNLFAEHFLKQIAVEKNGLGNRNDAIDLVKEYWEEQGLSMENIFMEDGSGLSHFNAVSPAFFTRYLTRMASNDAFVESLPVAGEGTFKRFNTENLPGTTLQAKSGSMTRVRCYSGYLSTDKGNKLVFSFMFNNFGGSHSALIKEVEQLFVQLKTEY